MLEDISLHAKPLKPQVKIFLAVRVWIIEFKRHPSVLIQTVLIVHCAASAPYQGFLNPNQLTAVKPRTSRTTWAGETKAAHKHFKSSTIVQASLRKHFNQLDIFHGI